MIRRPIFALFAVAAVLALAACSNVGAQLKAERIAFNGSLTMIHAGHVAGAVPSKAERDALPFLQATQASLDAGDAAYKAGDKTTASVYAKAAAAGLAKLDATLKATTKPTTQPK